MIAEKTSANETSHYRILQSVCGVIERRVLINYRVEPVVAAKLLPPPFRLNLVKGWAVAGICLIRLKDVRPLGWPAWCGIKSENAAHRIAVEWDEASGVREGVFIPRRDTDAWLNSLLGGRFFPGYHHAASFDVNDTGSTLKLSAQSRDGMLNIGVRARVAEALPASSIFNSLEAAAEFFRQGCAGYSATPNRDRFDGLALYCPHWEMQPLAVDHLTSSFFGDEARFPRGTAHFDSAFVMRKLEHEWRTLNSLRTPPKQQRRSPTPCETAEANQRARPEIGAPLSGSH